MGTWVLILFLMTADGGTYSTTMQNIQSRGQCVSAGEDYSSRGYNGDTVTSYMCVEGR